MPHHPLCLLCGNGPFAWIHVEKTMDEYHQYRPTKNVYLVA